MFNPIEFSNKIKEQVCKNDSRKYYRFRKTNFYGGCATADCLGCNLRCAYCWGQKKVWHSKKFGNYSSLHLQYNIIYRNNTIWNCEYSFEIWDKPESANMSNIYFQNNTCYNAGFGWSHSQRPDPVGFHLLIGDIKAKTKNIFISNNTFYESKAACVFIINNTLPYLNNITLDYNKYYTSAYYYMYYYNDSIYSIYDLPTFQSEFKKDLHSIILNNQPKPPQDGGNDDNDDNGEEEPVISFGYYYLLFSIITILGIIITSKKFKRQIPIKLY